MALQEYNSVRIASNYRHGSIAPPFDASIEMPMPEFDRGHGWFSPKGNSKFTGSRDGFIDFNFKECTGSTADWKFAYLMGQSEYSGSNGKPPEWSRNNWKFNDTRPNNTSSSLDECGLNANTLFTNGRGNISGNKKFRPYTRKANNLSNRFMWGVMESPNFAKNAYTTHNYTGKSHHVRAAGITFRYYVHFNEDKGSLLGGLNNQHGGTPIEAFCLAYVKKADNRIYLAECITVSNKQATDDNPFPPNSANYWIANNKMSQYGQSTTQNNLKVWQEHGPKNNSNWDVDVDGVATLTISRDAAEKVWDQKMVCVGFVATSVHSSRQSGYVGSAMWFDMWDVKLLEMEYRGHTDFVTSGGEEDPKFTRVLRPSNTKGNNLDYYHNPGNMFTMDLLS